MPKQYRKGIPTKILHMISKLRKMKERANINMSKNEYEQQKVTLDEYLTKWYKANLDVLLILERCRIYRQ